MNKKDINTVSEIIESTKLMADAVNLLKDLRRGKCRDIVIEDKFVLNFGLNRVDLLPTLLQYFYEFGKEDALQEIKDKL